MTFYLPDGPQFEASKSLVHKIYGLLSDGLHFAAPFSSARTNEAVVVCLVVDQMCYVYFSLAHKRMLTSFTLGTRSVANVTRFLQ